MLNMLFELIIIVTLVLYCSTQTITKQLPITDKGALMMDCGSTGTRLHIYHWKKRTDITEIPEILELHSIKIDSPIAAGVTEARQVISELVTQAKQYVPAEMQKDVSIYAFATAGMRVLTETQSIPIWTAIREVLSTSGFKFVSLNARTISGNTEAVFGWLSANYLDNKFIGQSVGSMDLGGSSVQIAFATESSILNGYTSVVVGSQRYSVYTVSYMNRGANQAAKAAYFTQWKTGGKNMTNNVPIVYSPCHVQKYSQAGVDVTPVIDMMTTTNKALTPNELNSLTNMTVMGTGDWDGCVKLVEANMDIDCVCIQKPCAMNGVYQPSIPDQTFYAYSAFYYSLSGIGATDSSDVFSAKWSTVPQYGRDWLNDPSRVTSGFGTQYGIQSAAAYAYVTKGFKFSDTESMNIIVSGTINGVSASWTVGAVIDELQFIPIITNTNSASIILHTFTFSVCILQFLFFSV